MSTSLYHAFGLKGIQYKASRYESEYLIFEAEMVTKDSPCPCCGKTDIIFKGSKPWQLLLPSIGRKKCLLDLLFHRVQCLGCRASGGLSFLSCWANIQRMYRTRPIKNVRYIGIDEFAIKKGHRYMTIGNL